MDGWSTIIWLLLVLSLTLSFVIIYIDNYYYYLKFHFSTRYWVSKKQKTKKRKIGWIEWLQKTQCLLTLAFKRLNLCLGIKICASSFVILTSRRGEPDHKGSNPSRMTRKKQKKPVQQKSIHEFITKGTLTPPTTQPTMKIINQNDTPTPQPIRFQWTPPTTQPTIKIINQNDTPTPQPIRFQWHFQS